MSVNFTRITGEIVAETSQGQVSGLTFTLDDEKTGHLFYNVPYAHIPTGPRRFAPPEAIANWYDEDVLHRVRLEQNPRHLPEIYLKMDIYTTEVKNHSDEEFDRPVIVFVPGDVQSQFLFYKYGPQYLLRENVVLVIVSYRVGILGFVKFADPHANAPGDVGLMDLKAAFTWIRKEIANFGGCSKNVTAYGHGLGAKHIRQLLTSSLSENSFDKAILSSCMEHEICVQGLYENGNYIGPWLAYTLCYLMDRNSEISTDLTKDDLACVDILRKMDIAKLQVMNTLLIVKYTSEILITKKKLRKLRRQLYKAKIPIIIGYTSQECSFERHLDDKLNCKAVLDPKKTILKTFIEEHGGVYQIEDNNLLKRIAQDFLNRFHAFRALDLSHLTPIQRKRHSIFFFTLSKYVVGIATIAKSMARQMSPENVFLYRFSVVNTSTYKFGLPHGKELHLLFKSNWIGWNQKADNRTTEEKEWSRLITKVWAQFARTGNPNLTEPHDLIKSVWQPVNQGPLSHCFNISRTGWSYGENPNTKTMIYMQNKMIGVNFLI